MWKYKRPQVVNQPTDQNKTKQETKKKKKKEKITKVKEHRSPSLS